jgi:hypothetical protein
VGESLTDHVCKLSEQLKEARSRADAAALARVYEGFQAVDANVEYLEATNKLRAERDELAKKLEEARRSTQAEHDRIVQRLTVLEGGNYAMGYRDGLRFALVRLGEPERETTE